MIPTMPALVPTKPKYTRPPRKGHRSDYGVTHQKMRAARLAAHPICEECQADWSYHAHHLRYPATCIDDYRALCEGCHAKAHGKSPK